MHFSQFTLAAFAATAIAAPVITKRAGITSDELEDGPCKDVTFIMARASTEPGNMGATVGPSICNSLKAKYGAGSVACQGVGRPYNAGLATNALPGGSSPAAFQESEKMFNLAHSKCPQSVVVGGGYSQGSAVMTGSVGKLDPDVQQQVAGVVLFGDTRNAQTKGTIPGFPVDKVKVFCKAGDGVCKGTLAVTPAHLAYQGEYKDGAAYLEQQIDAAKSGGGSATGSTSGSSGTDSSGTDSTGTDSSGLGGLGGLSSGGLGGLSGGGLSSGGLGGLSGGGLSGGGLSGLGGLSGGGLSSAGSDSSSDSGSDLGSDSGSDSGLSGGLSGLGGLSGGGLSGLSSGGLGGL